MSPASAFNGILFALLGVLVFTISFVIVARALPGDLWNRALKEQNLQASVILAAVALALGWIVASAVH